MTDDKHALCDADCQQHFGQGASASSQRPQSATVKKPKPWTIRDIANLRMSKLKSMYNNPRYSDCILSPQDESQTIVFHAQKSILSTWSPCFDSMFFGEQQSEIATEVLNTASIDIDAKPHILELFLKYVYHGEMVIELDDLWPFYCFLNTYQVEDLIDQVEDIMDRAVNVDNCCSLLASAADIGCYDHYALRKCLNLLLMDFTEVSLTPGFLSIDFDVLVAVIGSDEVNAAEETIFEACMRWVVADDARADKYLDALLQHIRFPLMNAQYVAELDTHPMASKSQQLHTLMLAALKYAVNPRGMGKQNVTGIPTAFRQRKGGLYWKTTKNNMCMDIASNHFQTFVLNSPCDLVHSWKLKVEIFDGGCAILGVAEPTVDQHHYIGRFSDGFGLASNGNFYNGGCRCDHSVRHLCTPSCHAHIKIPDGAIVHVSFDVKSMNLKFVVNQKTFTRSLANDLLEEDEHGHVKSKPMAQRLHPAVSVRSAKIRIFANDADIFD